MFILQAKDVKKQYGERIILDISSFFVYEGDKIALVGANGTGKTTFMDILCGRLPLDEGLVDCRVKVNYLRQRPEQQSTLSGGENLKQHILDETMHGDSILFADEPTAHLDESGREWVRKKLESARTLVLVSHDRDLLDELCNRIVELKDGKLNHFTGTYTQYLAKKAEDEERLRQKAEQVAAEKKKLENAVQAAEKRMAKQRQSKRKEMAKNSSEARLGGHKRAASMKQQERIRSVLEGRIERLEQVEIPRSIENIRFDFTRTDPPQNKQLIQCEALNYGYGERSLFQNASFTIPKDAHIRLEGVNGCGKSTLLRLIHEGHPNLRKAPKLKTGLLTQDLRHIDDKLTILENVKRQCVQNEGDLRSVLAGLLFSRDEVHKQAGVLSGGERLRLALAMLVTGDYNMLLLDEPSNHLDIPSLEAVERLLCGYPGAMVLVSHDKRFAGAVCNSVLRIQNGQVVNPEQSSPRPASSRDERLILEMRRTRLVAAISSAPPEVKERLEVELSEIVKQLHH